MLHADDICKNEDTVCIDGMWVAARPMQGELVSRIRDAWQVLKGTADAIKFYKQ